MFAVNRRFFLKLVFQTAFAFFIREAPINVFF